MYRPLKPEKWALSSGHIYSGPYPIAIAEISGKVNKWLKYESLHCIKGTTLLNAELQLDYVVPIPLLIQLFTVCFAACLGKSALIFLIMLKTSNKYQAKWYRLDVCSVIALYGMKNRQCWQCLIANAHMFKTTCQCN